MTENLVYYPRHGYVESHRAEHDGFRRCSSASASLTDRSTRGMSECAASLGPIDWLGVKRVGMLRAVSPLGNSKGSRPSYGRTATSLWTIAQG